MWYKPYIIYWPVNRVWNNPCRHPFYFKKTDFFLEMATYILFYFYFPVFYKSVVLKLFIVSFNRNCVLRRREEKWFEGP